MQKFKEWGKSAVGAFKSGYSKIAAGGTALVASGAAFAGATSPGSAIAAELSGGKADMMLVIIAVAVLLGLLLVWGYTKRAK